ncbi:MAG: NAD(+)/NADH kinase [Planctomycetes bacterium]|nr:NAD(+)/NADH kinase [Planctomycetota bacterium]
MRVIMLGASGRPDVVEHAERLKTAIAPFARIAATDFTGTADLAAVEADLVIVLGGDGSILRAAHQMGHRQLPVVAVNLGRLGFLADLSPEEASNVVRDAGLGKLPVVEHLMFECRVLRGGKVLHQQLGLNEVAVQTGTTFAMLEVDLHVDSELVTTYSCDGLIISTPVGSTAHSLSAGGPILRKDLQAFVISPISPHTLSNRPVVDAADRVYELGVTIRPGADCAVVVDGRVLCRLQDEDRVRVERAGVRFKLVDVPGHSYYRTLREKLGWGGRLRSFRHD